jgi:hypothetical protein
MVDRFILCGQDISEEDFLHFFRLDFRYTFNSSYKLRKISKLPQ